VSGFRHQEGELRGQAHRAWERRLESLEAGRLGGWEAQMLEAGKPGGLEAKKLGSWEARKLESEGIGAAQLIVQSSELKAES